MEVARSRFRRWCRFHGLVFPRGHPCPRGDWVGCLTRLHRSAVLPHLGKAGFLTVPRQRFVWLLLGAVVLYLLGHHAGTSNAEQSQTFTNAHAILDIGKAYRARQALFQRTAQALRDSARSQGSVARLRGLLVAKLDTALSKAVTQRDSLRIVLVERDTLKAQVTLWQAMARRWELADRADSSRAAVAEARVTALEANLTATLGVAECHILAQHWLPRCPSRTAMFFLGAGTATAALLATHH
jgi:hypothetical protein